MTDKIIDEVMVLIKTWSIHLLEAENAMTQFEYDIAASSTMAAGAAIRAKLREVLEKKPLALYQRDTIKANA